MIALAFQYHIKYDPDISYQLSFDMKALDTLNHIKMTPDISYQKSPLI